MQIIRLEGTLVKDPEFRSGVSLSGFEWESVDLYVEEGGVEKPSVYKVGGFGKIVNKVRDYNLQKGGLVECMLRVDSREGTGVHEGKFFMSLGIEGFDYKGMNNSATGVNENGYPVIKNDPVVVDKGDDILFSDGAIDDDLPF